MKIDIIKNPSSTEWFKLSNRPMLEQANLQDVIVDVFKNVQSEGDQALIKYTNKFDKVELKELKLDESFIKKAASLLDSDLVHAIDTAKNNIYRFHESQVTKTQKIETSPGVTCWQESRAIEAVGLYIPGGTAPLFSTVLMLGIPAKIAGCKEIILCTPPTKKGEIHPAIAYAASIAGINKIFTIGGAQAIAAMSLGTQSVPKVQKIFGPGNQYVTAAKQYAMSRGTAIDMPAGPSELLVICSDNSNPAFVAADLLSQAEHGIDSQVICLSNNIDKLEAVVNEVELQIPLLPRREIAEQAISNSKFIAFDTQDEMIEFSNEYAPEHLIIADEDFEHYIPRIENAGSVFLGNYCPESAGDYASGTNHTLPTAGYAKTYSGVNLDAFVKKITFQNITKNGIKHLGHTIEVLAAAEGLYAHKNAVSLRLNDLNR